MTARPRAELTESVHADDHQFRNLVLMTIAGMTPDAKPRQASTFLVAGCRDFHHPRELCKRRHVARTTGPAPPRPGTHAPQVETGLAFHPLSDRSNNLPPALYPQIGARWHTRADQAVFIFRLRSAHLCFANSDSRLRVAALMRRAVLALPAFLRRLTHIALAASEMRLRPAALMRCRRVSLAARRGRMEAPAWPSDSNAVIARSIR